MNGDLAENPLYIVTLTLAAGLDEDQAGRFAGVLADRAISTSFLRKGQGLWEVQWVVTGEPDQAAILACLLLQGSVMGVGDAVGSDIAVEPMPDVNWLERSYRQLPPFAVGPFHIYGSHAAGPVPAGLIPLQIDATTAFGSGEHGTTSGCMILMDDLKRGGGFHPRCALDMGCGSGILAIAAHRLWGCPVLAVDIDPEAARVTQHHCDINAIGDGVTAIAGDGFAAPLVDERKPFDLVIANILPQPLKEMAPAVAGVLAPAGRVILSGLLTHQTDDVAGLYGRHGFTLLRCLERGEWAALLLGREVLI